MTTPAELVDIVDRYVACYNAADYDGFAVLLHPDAELRHVNRGHSAKGRDVAVENMKRAEAVMPGKHFYGRRALHVAGDTAVVLHRWGGSLTADLPGIGRAGETVDLELCTVITVADSLIITREDFG